MPRHKRQDQARQTFRRFTWNLAEALGTRRERRAKNDQRASESRTQ
ncbi:hypothetical protein [Devosia pacifica]|nr:hypothetical protein [Devosia pacifica]